MPRTFFWQMCDSFSCARQWVFFSLGLLITLFTIFSLIQTFRFHKKCVFELLPLGMNVFCMFLLCLLQLLSKQFEYHLAAYIIEIYTYFLFCYSFTTLYFADGNRKKRRAKILPNVVFLVMTTVMALMVILVFAGNLSASCDREFMTSFYAFFGIEGFFYLLTIFFGILIGRRLAKKGIKEDDKRVVGSFGSSDTNNKDNYVRQRLKQILVILGAYSLSIILRVTWAILHELKSQTSITCIYADNSAYILKSLNVAGQFIMTLDQITQLVPHIVLPIALYVIPVSGLHKNKQIEFQQNLLEGMDAPSDIEEEMSREDFLKSQLSSRLSGVS